MKPDAHETIRAMNQNTETKNNHAIPRACGLLVIEVVNSNPNGDPDRDSDPRQRPDGLGEISPVSFKRKLRDIVDQKPPEWQLLKAAVEKRLGIGPLAEGQFQILERRGRVRDEVELDIYTPDDHFGNKFLAKYWDARVFGNTFLEKEDTIRKRWTSRKPSLAEEEDGKKLKQEVGELLKQIRRNIKSGAVQFGMGLSIKPISIRRNTQTNKAGVEEGMEQGMAPLGYRFVPQATYTMPFFINPAGAAQTKCRLVDIEVMLALLPLAYPLNPSSIRPLVRVVLAHVLEHENPLGSFPDLEVLRRLTPVPTQRGKPDEREEPLPAGYTAWGQPEVQAFLEEHAPKFARYRELLSGLEITSTQLS
ncbi:MAG: type I CRISPR-associated protein Cas7 [Verrucomicrobia bacterium]|nr:type I CRISPR-associated protein Cas7 [Verrucomicrobiota bacterium]NMD22342.1 type I CRISPR-associated protein Cas7 [Verrucomicrobiota bacterium]HOF48215.1 type I CRISPR-associated protein Cas7 [Verrucomicrobiota bacterium]HOR71481.1 type I CRISPR-associated protein Cas7 [Verrucomicrobiota bacterium]HPV10492.1 type I CRISPR-associated protein Cas7 [Verrucomicrobiota bacterium]